MKMDFLRPVNEGFSIYCGMLSLNRDVGNFFSNKSVWREIVTLMGLSPQEVLGKNGTPQEVFLTLDERKDLQTLFYDGVINCIYPSNDLRATKFYCYTHHYRMSVNQEVPLLESADSMNIKVVTIDFYILAKNMLIYTIETDISTKNLNEIALQNYIIRNVEYYPHGYSDKQKRVAINPAFVKLFTPIIKIHNCLNDDHLPVDDYSQDALKQFAYTLFRGNKLKVYCAVQLPYVSDSFATEYTTDYLLYELATCNEKMGLMLQPDNIYYPDMKYYNKLIEENTIACFANWKAISLLDSFVVLFQPNNKIGYSWRSFYFRYLYLNALCIRSFLVLMNDKYKRKEITEDIEYEFLMFDKTFNFHSVSYSFLPNLIYKKMKFGLEVGEELGELQNRITHFCEKQDMKNEKATGLILFWLAILTIFSAFSDAIQIYMNVESVNNRIWITCALAFIIILCIIYKFCRLSK